jgi:CHAT domain-containing protein
VTRRVLIAPDGALNLVPFAALVDQKGHYLVQHYEFSYLTSGRDLLRLHVKQESKQVKLVIANPGFPPLKNLRASSPSVLETGNQTTARRFAACAGAQARRRRGAFAIPR